MGMYNQQDGVCANRSDRNPALFLLAGIVALRKRERIFEREYGGFEANAMLAKILTVLVFVPGKEHGRARPEQYASIEK